MNKTCTISLVTAISLCASCQTNWQNLNGKAYALKGSLRADSGLVGKGHKEINAFMNGLGWN
ncbi:MAG: hypothetical protein UHS32_07065, partial [Bacteroidaceae bacterium]|nr:hypothetical protein [Bacteroidaceae bacterium]